MAIIARGREYLYIAWGLYTIVFIIVGKKGNIGDLDNKKFRS